MCWSEDGKKRKEKGSLDGWRIKPKKLEGLFSRFPSVSTLINLVCEPFWRERKGRYEQKSPKLAISDALPFFEMQLNFLVFQDFMITKCFN